MPFLVYAVVALAIFKLFVDVIGGNLLIPYSVFLENLIFVFFIAMLIRTSVKRRQGRRETLREEMETLRDQLHE